MALDQDAVVALEDDFHRLDRKNVGRLDLQDFLWCFESSRKILPSLLKVPSEEAEQQWRTFGSLDGLDVDGYIRAIEALVAAYPVSVRSPPQRAGHSRPSAVPQTTPDPKKKKKKQVGFRSETSAPPTRRGGTAVESSLKAQDSSRSKLSDRSSSSGLKRLGRWFGVVPPETGDGMMVVRKPTQAGANKFDRPQQSYGEDQLYDELELEGHSPVKKPKLTPPDNRYMTSRARKKRNNARQAGRQTPAPDFVIKDMFADTGNMPTQFDGRVAGEHGQVMITDYRAAVSAYRKYVAKEKVYKRKHFSRLLTSSSIGSSVDAGRTLGGKAPIRKDAGADEIKEQLRSLPTFQPRFIPVVTFIQLAVMCAMLFDSFSKSQFAKIGLTSDEIKCTTVSGGVPECPTDFSGTAITTAVQQETVNVWIGPDPEYLIHFGARFTPCMRHDYTISSSLDNQRASMCGTTGNPCDNQDTSGGEGYSCCTLLNRDYAMMSELECEITYGGLWLDELSRHRQCRDDDNLEKVTIKPCCIGNEGMCTMYTASQCSFYSGVFHHDKQLCSEVSCLGDTCKNIFRDDPIHTTSEGNTLHNYNQWWRFVWPLFMHAGVVHYVLCMLVQWVVGTQIERTAGWLRVGLIYFISGISGYIVSSLFDPYAVAVGSGPAVFGLLAVLVVELFQSWKLVPNPWWEFTKLVGIIAVAFVIGTFPFIDNFSHIGGFVFGIMASIIFLPYITFGKWDYARKRLLLYINGPLLVVLIITSLVAFYAIQDSDFCPWCKSLNCIEYSDGIKCD